MKKLYKKLISFEEDKFWPVFWRFYAKFFDLYIYFEQNQQIKTTLFDFFIARMLHQPNTVKLSFVDYYISDTSFISKYKVVFL